jgi:hypothetical protein
MKETLDFSFWRRRKLQQWYFYGYLFFINPETFPH